MNLQSLTWLTYRNIHHVIDKLKVITSFFFPHTSVKRYPPTESRAVPNTHGAISCVNPPLQGNVMNMSGGNSLLS